MHERFPDAKEEIIYHGGGNGNMRIGVMNFETNKQLILDMYYNTYEDRVVANVNCIGKNSESMNADTLFAADFIRNTNCLESDDSVPEPTSETTSTPKTGVVRLG